MSDPPSSLNSTLPADVTAYTGLITSEHSGASNFVATVAATAQPFADLKTVIGSLVTDFDFDSSIGAQEDADGARVGKSRKIEVALNVYFSLDVAGLGCDQGVWRRAFDPIDGVSSLDDPTYRSLLKATIAANSWDGTITGAYRAWSALVTPFGLGVLAQDYGNMTMAYALVGPRPPATIAQLFIKGAVDLRPAGVKLWYVLPTVYPAATGTYQPPPLVPLFGLDEQNAYVAGFDGGYLAPPTAPVVTGGTPLFGLDAETAAVAGSDVGAWGTFVAAT